MRKSFYGLVVCLSMFAVFICSGVATAAIGDPCTVDAECDDTLYCNGIESCSGEGSDTVCVAGTNPCSGDTPACVEGNDTCVECVVDGDCAEGEACEDNLCVEAECPEGTPPEVLAYDTDGNCLLSKDELKTYSDALKVQQKQAKDELKATQTEEKNTYKRIKSEYSE